MKGSAVTLEHWLAVILCVFGTVIVPTVGWLVKGVLSLKKDLIHLEMRILQMETHCSERNNGYKQQGNDMKENGAALRRVEIMLAKLCMRNGIPEEK